VLLAYSSGISLQGQANRTKALVTITLPRQRLDAVSLPLKKEIAWQRHKITSYLSC
jgi:hypothetical protein